MQIINLYKKKKKKKEKKKKKKKRRASELAQRACLEDSMYIVGGQKHLSLPRIESLCMMVQYN